MYVLCNHHAEAAIYINQIIDTIYVCIVCLRSLPKGHYPKVKGH